MKTLVTGGAGFIGSHLVDTLLEDGHHVFVVDNYYSGRDKNLDQARKIAARKNLQLETFDADISNALIWSKVPAVDAVFHTAAQTSVTVSVKESHRDFSWNVLASKFIIDYMRANSVKHFLYTNTAGALYGVPSQIPTPETHTLYPTSPYGATKSFFETYIRALTVSLKSEGVYSNKPQDHNYFTWASLRLGNVYGPRQITKGEAGVVPIFIEKLLANSTPTIFGSGKETRDYVHVADVVSAFMHIFKLQQQSPIDDAYNVGTGQETQTQEVFEYVKNNMQGKTQTDKSICAPLRPGELERSCLDISKLKKLGWSPLWSFKDGVKDTVEHYLEFEKQS
ncbi:MAG: GDP-mannose 4,6-dehydratase [Bdellovibrionota bacterium]